MRIALVAPLVSPIAQPYIGGAQALLADLAEELYKRGHEITLFARAGSHVDGVTLESIAVPEQVRPASFSALPLEETVEPGFFVQANLFLEIFLQIERRYSDFDLVHVHAFDWPAYACSRLVQAIPVLHTLHLPAISSAMNQALQVFHRQGHPLTLITVSQNCAQTYTPWTSIDYVVPNGLDIEAIPFQATRTANAPLLFVGRISPEKGVEAAIEIAQLADSPLIIAGGIYNQDYYTQRIAPRLAQAGQQITYLGSLKREHIWQLMGQAAALLCPIAWDEPFGLAPVEAMATGTPVIAFKRGAMAEIIKDRETGFLVEPDACSQAAARVKDLASISRTNCRIHVEKHFSMAKMVEHYERIYREVAG